MKKILLLLLAGNLAFAVNMKTIKKNVQKNLPQLKIDAVKKTPIKGIYEIDSGRKIIYVDASGNYGMIGNLIDLKNKINITQNRMQTIDKVDWSDLPLSLAIRREIGEPKQNRIAVFTDPDCPFCRRFEKETIDKLDDIAVYYYLFPLDIHPNARKDSQKILCSENPLEAMDNLMIKGQNLKSRTDCKNATSLIKMMGVATDTVQITGTPTIVLPNGKIVSGLIDAVSLKKMIKENSK